jgi:tRNA pseudouridine55 synthase
MRVRRDEGPSGFLVVDKPAGRTSHDVVDAARRWLGTRRIGHLGTLDPLATGVLPLAVRDATKLVPFVEGGRKRYEAQICLGFETDTLDADGRVTERFAGALPEASAVRAALAAFAGEILQVPPMYSAIKQGGIPLHRLARQGAAVERAPRPVTIHAVELVAYAPPALDIALECSPGTYVRVLASDLGRRLGCFGHVVRLRRTASGPFTLAQAREAGVLEQAAGAGRIAELLLPAVEVLGLPQVRLDADDARRVGHGGELRLAPTLLGAAGPGDRLAALDAAGTLLAVLEVGHDRLLRPLRVLAGS